MKNQMQRIFGATLIAAGLGVSGLAIADDKAENLKVLEDTGKDLEKGMKAMAKGLGVKCTGCHVKGKWASDEVAAKGKARTFFETAVGNADKAKVQEALKPVLTELKLDKPADMAELDKALGLFKKKK